MNYPALIVVAIMALFVVGCFHVEKAKQESIEDEDVDLFI